MRAIRQLLRRRKVCDRAGRSDAVASNDPQPGRKCGAAWQATDRGECWKPKWPGRAQRIRWWGGHRRRGARAAVLGILPRSRKEWLEGHWIRLGAGAADCAPASRAGVLLTGAG